MVEKVRFDLQVVLPNGTSGAHVRCRVGVYDGWARVKAKTRVVPGRLFRPRYGSNRRLMTRPRLDFYY